MSTGYWLLVPAAAVQYSSSTELYITTAAVHPELIWYEVYEMVYMISYEYDYFVHMYVLRNFVITCNIKR